MASLADNETVIRFLHILSGITWIGMLYFFNLVNLPLLKFQMKKPYEANMAEKVTGPITVKTLFWFRWGAAFTVLFGLLLLGVEQMHMSSLPDGTAITQCPDGTAGSGLACYFLHNGMTGYAISMGIVLALVMAFNVWFVIWPRQKKILLNNKAIAASTDDAEKKRLGDENAPLVKTAVLASRLNTWFSIPMLWGMVFGAHGYSRGNTFKDWYSPLAVLGLVLILMWMYATVKPKPAAK
ncbi:MAG: hypothetical protein V4510_08225 [bacterium]